MTQCLLLFSIGVFSVSFFPDLPPLWSVVLGVLAGLLIACRYKDCRCFALFSGLFWGVFCGSQLLQHQLPEGFENREFLVVGRVVSLPTSDNRRSRFQLQVESSETLPEFEKLPLQKLLLSWYGERPKLLVGQRWQLQVKLRRPRGLAIPGGFNYRQWLLQQEISATGYVRVSDVNKLLGQRVGWIGSGLGSWRQALQNQLHQLDVPQLQKALLQALIVGDGAALSSEQWALFNGTGTTHLMVISGLHIGLFSLLCYFLGNLLARVINLFFPVVPAQLWASIFALAGATFYAALSGFGLPATRALAMISALLLVRWLRNSASPFSYLTMALAAVSVVDPLAPHSSGFWLSFLAVFGLLWVFLPQVKSSGKIKAPGGVPEADKAQETNRWKRYLRNFCYPQWVVFVILAAPLLLSYGQLSLPSIGINTVAIPWLSFLIVPLCLLGVVLSLFSTSLTEFVWQLAGQQLQWFYGGLEKVGSGDGLMAVSALPLSVTSTLLLMVSAMWLLLPRGVPGRWLGVVPFVLIFMAIPQRPELEITVLDVGQGLAVVVLTKEQALVYDTGATFSDKFNMGSAVIAPFLRQRGVTKIDKLIVSHSDNDHAGGVPGLLSSLPVDAVLVGEPLHTVKNAEICREGHRWKWGEIYFEILSPPQGDSENVSNNNNASCVLLVSAGERRILLPGDIEASRESRLLDKLPAVDIVVAPHHGSSTSSSPGFIAALKPAEVIYSAGYKHHFGHPHPDVVARYQNAGARQWSTAESGAVTLTLASIAGAESGDNQAVWQVTLERTKQGHFWQ